MKVVVNVRACCTSCMPALEGEVVYRSSNVAGLSLPMPSWLERKLTRLWPLSDVASVTCTSELSLMSVYESISVALKLICSLYPLAASSMSTQVNVNSCSSVGSPVPCAPARRR